MEQAVAAPPQVNVNSHVCVTGLSLSLIHISVLHPDYVRIVVPHGQQHARDPHRRADAPHAFYLPRQLGHAVDLKACLLYTSWETAASLPSFL